MEAEKTSQHALRLLADSVSLWLCDLDIRPIRREKMAPFTIVLPDLTVHTPGVTYSETDGDAVARTDLPLIKMCAFNNGYTSALMLSQFHVPSWAMPRSLDLRPAGIVTRFPTEALESSRYAWFQFQMHWQALFIVRHFLDLVEDTDEYDIGNHDGFTLITINREDGPAFHAIMKAQSAQDDWLAAMDAWQRALQAAAVQAPYTQIVKVRVGAQQSDGARWAWFTVAKAPLSNLAMRLRASPGEIVGDECSPGYVKFERKLEQICLRGSDADAPPRAFWHLCCDDVDYHAIHTVDASARASVHW